MGSKREGGKQAQIISHTHTMGESGCQDNFFSGDPADLLHSFF